MNNTQQPNLPTPSQALNILVQAVEAAQAKGVYSIQDAVFIATSVNVLREIHPQEEEPETEQAPAATAPQAGSRKKK